LQAQARGFKGFRVADRDTRRLNPTKE